MISMIQFFVLCFVSAFGDAMTSLPATIAEDAQEDMWLSVIVGGVVFMFTVWIAAKLCSFFPTYTCIEYHCILLGPVVGQLVNVLLVGLFMLVPIISVRTFVVAASMYLFDVTPGRVIAVTVLLLLLYAGQYGWLPIIRLQQLIFISSHMVFFLIILVGLLAIDLKHYQPFLANGFTPVLKGAIPAWYAYTGPEMVIGLLYPFITRQKEVFKWGAACIGALIFVYTLITVIVQGILGPKETAHLLSPTILAYRSVEIPDTFIERVDGYFHIFWIPVFVVCMLDWYHFAAFGIKRMLKLEDSRPVVALLLPIIQYFIDVPPDFQTAGKIAKMANFAFGIWGLGVLPLLLLIAWLKEKRRNAC